MAIRTAGVVVVALGGGVAFAGANIGTESIAAVAAGAHSGFGCRSASTLKSGPASLIDAGPLTPAKRAPHAVSAFNRGFDFLLTWPSLANADRLMISVDKNTQSMTVSVDGLEEYVWPVSTGVAGYATPSGTYEPFRMEEFHYSEEWDDAPMPNSIFFTRMGHAIHGTEHIDKLGNRASHGCIRLDPANAATLFDLVQEVGLPNTTVVVAGPGARVKKAVVVRTNTVPKADEVGLIEMNTDTPAKPKLWPYERLK